MSRLPVADVKPRLEKLQRARIGGVCRLLGETRGAVTIEFSLVAPILLFFLLALVEVTNMITAARRLESVANSMSQMITQSSTGSVNYIDVNFAMDSTMVLFPHVLSDSYAKGVAWKNDISLTLSSVVFYPPSVNPVNKVQCKTPINGFCANVAWSGGSNPRPCATNLAAAADSATPSSTALPTDAFGAGSIVVADVVYTYTPVFLSTVLPQITISRSAYVRPRYIPPTSYIAYSVIAGDNGIASSCTGY